MWHNSNERDKVPNETNHNKFLSNKCSPWEQIPNANATNNRQILTRCGAFLESKFQIRSMKLKLVEAVSCLRTQTAIDSANSSSTVSSTNWTLIRVFYSLNTTSCACTKDVTLSIQCTCTLKNCLLLQKSNKKNGRLALPCALRSHDYHVTGSANQNADMQIKYKKRKNETNRIKQTDDGR